MLKKTFLVMLSAIAVLPFAGLNAAQDVSTSDDSIAFLGFGRGLFGGWGGGYGYGGGWGGYGYGGCGYGGCGGYGWSGYGYGGCNSGCCGCY